MIHKINFACYSWLRLVETDRDKWMDRFLLGTKFIYLPPALRFNSSHLPWAQELFFCKLVVNVHCVNCPLPVPSTNALLSP
jgi:hypothetical protein